MKIRFYVFLGLYSLLFLFYPGDSRLYKIFAYNRTLFAASDSVIKKTTDPVPYLKAPYYPIVSAEGIYVVDLTTLTPIFERRSKNLFYPASTTKIITALVANEVFKPTDIITVSRNLEDGQIMGLVVGEKMTVENLLYGLLVHSGNDAAYALADGYGFDRFVDLMNKKALEIGMKETHFVNPAGLDDPTQLSTPFDLILAARELLQTPELKKIVAIRDITVADTDFKYFHRLSNVNKLLGEIQGVGGLKTGYTESAGENLISFYKKNNHQFVIAVLKSLDRFNDTRQIISWIDTNVDFVSP